MVRIFRLVPIALFLTVSTALGWSIRDEGYSCGTVGMTLAQLQSAGITLVSHVPCTKEWFDEAAKYGIRALPYISLYKVYDVNAPGADPTHPFWRAVDMTHHPEWVYVGPDGKWRRPFNNPFYPKPYWQSCTNTAGIADAYCRGVKAVLELGAGGVFIDNVLPARICYGPKFGIHQHLYPDKDNIYSFKIALKRVQDTVKSFGEDKVIILNVGKPWNRWTGFGDCIMFEGFIYNVRVRPGPGGWVGNEIFRTKKWSEILECIRETKPFIDGGGCIVSLECLPNDPEAAVYTYACAKLGNFLWSASMRVRRDFIRTLHRCRLQNASGPLKEKNGVYFRHYPNGMAVVNGSDERRTASLPVPEGIESLADVLTGDILPVRGGMVKLSLDADTGRVYVTPRHLAEGHLREVLVALQEATESVSPRGNLESAIETARHAQRIVKENPREESSRAVADLCRKLWVCEHGVEGQTLSSRLAAGANLTRAEVRKMMQSSVPNLRCKIDTHQVTIAAGDVEWKIGGERATVCAGDIGVNCGVSIEPLHETCGWLHPYGIESAKLITDKNDRKIVRITMPLRGSKNGKIVPEIKLLITAEARRGENCLRLKTAIVNTGNKDIPVYTTWSSWHAGIWCSYPGQPSVRSDRYVNFGKSEWTFIHRSQSGGKGLLIITDLPQSYSPYAWNIYSEPRSGTLPPDGKRKIDFDVYVVPTSWWEDPVAAGAFLRARIYASLAYFATAGTGERATIQTDKTTIAGEPLKVVLRHNTGEKIEATGAALLNEKSALVPEGKPEIHDGIVSISTPPTLRNNRYFQLAVSYLTERSRVPVVSFIDIKPEPSLSLVKKREGAVIWDGRHASAVLAVENKLDTETTCELEIDCPEGYMAPKRKTITLAANERRDISIEFKTEKASPPPSGATAILRLRPSLAKGEQRLALHFAPQLTCPLFESSPIIDGKLDDQAWKEAAVTTPFVLIGGRGEPREPTVAMVGYDRKYLYVAFRCTESDMKSLVANVQPKPGVSNKAVHNDDSVEVFLSPTRDGEYIQLVSNSLGAQKMSKSIRWDVAGTRGERGWAVEMRIEFASIGFMPKAGDIWSANFCRMEQRLKEASLWSPTDRSFHQSERFGLLVFGE